MESHTGFLKALRQKNFHRNRAFKEAISEMALSLKKISEGQIKNNLIYRKTKKQLEKKFPGKYAIIADGKFLGVEDSLENVWILASPHKNTQVTKITKEHARILGSS